MLNRETDNYLPFIEVLRPENFQNNKISQDKTLKYKSDLFADNVEVSFTPENSGKWDSTDFDKNIWRIGLYSRGASSMNIVFNSFKLLPGTKIFLYSPSYQLFFGAYTFRNNNHKDMLAISPIMNDSIIIELQVQKNNEKYGELNIGQVGLGFPLPESNKSTDDRWHGTSADCHVDINCLTDKEIQLQKHAVCRIIYNNTSRCTGTLINNTRNDSRPLVLTAAHCISNESRASTAICFFDYESPFCNGPDGSIKSISGSRLLATNEMLDFSLIELNDKVPYDYHPVYSGWDISKEPFTKSFTIHHPEGDVKKIAVNDGLVFDGGEIGMQIGSSWVVSDYETGSTEFGSSGSALFDSAFHIRGTLTSGGEVCTPYIYDSYSKFDRSWNYYSDSSIQLAHWLDPLNQSTSELDSYIPTDPLLDYSQQLTNITSGDSLIIQEQKNGWGYPSGLNSSGTTEYAEYFYNNGTKYIYALEIGVARVRTASAMSKIIFKIWDGDNYPENMVFKKELLLFELADADTNLIRLDTSIYVNKGFFVGYEILDEEVTDTLAIYYADPRIRNSENTAFVYKDNGWQPLYDGSDNIGTSLAILPLVFDYYVDDKTIPGEFPYSDITLYPNPAKNYIQILFKEKPMGEFIYQICDLSGKIIVNRRSSDIEPNYSIDISKLSQGMYIIKVSSSEMIYKNKFVKVD